jgi:uncharacterized protein YjbI with pentapeptide repeats
MNQSIIFISYSHKDEREKNKLLPHLGVLQREGLINLWSDDRIGAGADWEQEISEAMAQARVAILLISANFLNSDFILGKEVPTLLQRREREGLIVFPVITKACAWQEVEWLTRMNVRPKNGRPIWGAGSRRINEDLTAIAKEVAAIVKTSPPVASTASGVYVKLEELGKEDLPQSLESIPLRERQYQIAQYWAENGRKASLARFDLSEADLQLVDLDGVKLGLANLSKANLHRASLKGADLRLANLNRANLSKAKLSGADLSGANLRAADLSRANLSGADLSGANLREANLSEADLSGANLSEADLNEADLDEADLSGADLWAVDLREAKLNGAKLIGADLWGA